jgi:hypothetical protein
MNKILFFYKIIYILIAILLIYLIFRSLIVKEQFSILNINYKLGDDNITLNWTLNNSALTTLAATPATPAATTTAKDEFDLADKDGNDKIDEDEYKNYLTTFGLNKDQIKSYWDEDLTLLDKNGDNELSRAEINGTATAAVTTATTTTTTTAATTPATTPATTAVTTTTTTTAATTAATTPATPDLFDTIKGDDDKIYETEFKNYITQFDIYTDDEIKASWDSFLEGLNKYGENDDYISKKEWDAHKVAMTKTQ